MKLISFTLYGKDPKYVTGLFRNIPLQKQFYPDWNIIVYHDNSVDQDALDKLSEDCILKNVDGCGISAAAWRFLAHDEDCERFIVRDSDSRISEREALAVKEWEESDKTLHIMRDHPHHGYAILGGMWGMKKDPTLKSMKDVIISYQEKEYQTEEAINRDVWSMKDMHFLRGVIYSHLAKPETSVIHAATDYMHKVGWSNENWSKDFPIPRNEDKNFIGEIFVFDEQGREKREYQYTEI